MVRLLGLVAGRRSGRMLLLLLRVTVDARWRRAVVLLRLLWVRPIVLLLPVAASWWRAVLQLRLIVDARCRAVLRLLLAVTADEGRGRGTNTLALAWMELPAVRVLRAVDLLPALVCLCALPRRRAGRQAAVVVELLDLLT